MKISVIIPVRNEAGSIRALLDGLLNQSLTPEEILITDGGSTDNTPAIVREYAQLHSNVRLFCEANALPGRGRNIAAANATHEWLAFIDGGVEPARDWLAQLAECAARDANTDVVYGAWEPVTDTLFKECAAIAYAFVPDRHNADEVMRARAIVSSLMRRSVWQSVGGFPEHLRSAEDHLFIRKIDENGFTAACAPDALVRWTIEPNVWLTFKRFVVYSRNNLRAGLGRQWQTSILVRYGILLLITLAAALVTHWWPVITLVTLFVLLASRALVALWRNRRTFPAGIGRNLQRFLVLIPLLLILDTATILGTAHWLLRDKLIGENRSASV